MGYASVQPVRAHGPRIARTSRPSATLRSVKHATLSTIPSAEKPALTDEERTKRLRALADRLRDAHGLDWDTLATIEQQSAPER
jgi:hypothetical protein